MQLQVGGLNVMAPPESLVGIVDDHVLQAQPFHLAEKFGCVDACVAHQHVIAVPYCRAGPSVELAPLHKKAVDVPQGVLAPETAVHNLYV